MHSPFAFRRPKLLRSKGAFSAEEVRERLQLEDDVHPRTAAVHAAAAHTGVWCSLLSDRLAADLGRASTRLPTVVFWYRQGVPRQEIGRRLSPLGNAWDADRALDVAVALIAEALNRPGLRLSANAVQ